MRANVTGSENCMPACRLLALSEGVAGLACKPAARQSRNHTCPDASSCGAQQMRARADAAADRRRRGVLRRQDTQAVLVV